MFENENLRNVSVELLKGFGAFASFEITENLPDALNNFKFKLTDFSTAKSVFENGISRMRFRQMHSMIVIHSTVVSFSLSPRLFNWQHSSSFLRQLGTCLFVMKIQST
jgi:hypothetical protein